MLFDLDHIIKTSWARCKRNSYHEILHENNIRYLITHIKQRFTILHLVH